jgi:hypothetical protein
MHQINVVASLKILSVWKALKKINYFLKGMSVRVRVFFLFYPFTVPFPNTTSMFFTISNTSFPVYYFGELYFSIVLSKWFLSHGTYVFLARTTGVSCTPIFWMMEGTLMQFYLRKQDICHSSL